MKRIFIILMAISFIAVLGGLVYAQSDDETLTDPQIPTAPTATKWLVRGYDDVREDNVKLEVVWKDSDGDIIETGEYKPRVTNLRNVPNVAAYCENPELTSKSTCEAAGTCSLGPDNTDQATCEARELCTDSEHTDQTACEGAGETWLTGSWAAYVWTPKVVNPKWLKDFKDTSVSCVDIAAKQCLKKIKNAAKVQVKLQECSDHAGNAKITALLNCP